MTKSNKMSHERFTELVQAYGADPARWPTDERDEALVYRDAFPAEAALVLAPEQGLDQVLETARVTTSDTSFLAARILKATQETATTSAGSVVGDDKFISFEASRRSNWKSIAATFVITTGIGFAAGQSAAAKSARIAEAETLLSLILENPYDSVDLWEDL